MNFANLSLLWPVALATLLLYLAWKFSRDPPQEPSTEVHDNWLVCVAGPLRGRSLCLSAATHTLGRSRQNTVTLQDHCISRRQLMVTPRRSGHLQVNNLSSSVSVYLSGEVLAPGEVAELQEGGSLTVGEHIFRFHRVLPEPPSNAIALLPHPRNEGPTQVN